MAGRAGAPVAQQRSSLGTLAVAAAAFSAIAFVLLLIGAAAGMEGFQEGEDATLLGGVLWFSFMFGALVALIVGLIALVIGLTRRRAGDRRAGAIAVSWFALAVLAILVINMLDG